MLNSSLKKISSFRGFMGKFVCVAVAINTGSVAELSCLSSVLFTCCLLGRPELLVFDLVGYCMAAASSNGRAIAGSFGKRLTNQLWAAKQCDSAMLLISRRASHSGSNYDKGIEEQVNPVEVPDYVIRTQSEKFWGSNYDKEIEEQVNPVEVPDYVIGTQSEKYWGPNPATGVFGPDDPKAGVLAKGGGRGRSEPPESGNRGMSALDETVWFRQFDVDDVDPEDQN